MNDDEEAKAALLKLRTYEGWEDGEKLKITNLYRFLVCDNYATNGELRSYITPRAVWNTDALFGQCTFGYIAYDITMLTLVYLKDFWHTNLPRIQKEGDMYQRLHDAEVPNIPVLGSAGDVPLSSVHTSTSTFSMQTTKTQDYLKGFGGRGEWCPSQLCIEPYMHYRLVLETLGQPLNTFKSTRQLCEVIWDAIVGKECLFLFANYELSVHCSLYCGIQESSYITLGYQRCKHSDYG